MLLQLQIGTGSTPPGTPPSSHTLAEDPDQQKQTSIYLQSYVRAPIQHIREPTTTPEPTPSTPLRYHGLGTGTRLDYNGHFTDI